ncbi:hypothetical protein ACFDAU_11775 [Sulfuriferula sp. GW1]|uniref:hypothetical protein n=1 Tax=Sulfuriferula sp. GW1 TaxID=3345111 RepID=UPI0039B0F732
MQKHILLAEKFCQGEYECDVDDKMWRSVFEYMLNNSHSMPFDKPNVHTLWTVNGGHLRRKIKDDDLILSVLEIALPGYSGKGLILYRGECRFLYDENKIGFCWTPEIDVALMFASGLNSLESGGVLLKAYAPPSAIMASPNDHSAKQMREFEYTCNPHLLLDVEVVRLFEKQPRY